ncbi:hypothetical protein COY27_00725 [Candidatus Woesearchaeota archaeon CG_4_10_14_0_2_um_filter_33_13]|nr:MAG: hypothetical protein COY27_00725 [Candidatus Woesearchaeota archaeon CG_4_10_14_0_2_um_filter_33_13]
MKNWQVLNQQVQKNNLPDSSQDSSQSRILYDLMYKKECTFNQLWNKNGRSNNFAYHVKKLETDGLIKKTEQGTYKLTIQGKKRVAYLKEMVGDRFELPIVAVVMIIQKDDKILMLKRTKEPFHGYWGVHGGKLKSTNYILEQAADSIKTETGLTCDLKLKGVFSSKSYLNNEFAYGHQLFVVKATNPKGKLLKETKKGINQWYTKEKIEKLNILPSLPHLFNIVESKHFRWIEADRFQEDVKGDDQFKRTKVWKDLEF